MIQSSIRCKRKRNGGFIHELVATQYETIQSKKDWREQNLGARSEVNETRRKVPNSLLPCSCDGVLAGFYGVDSLLLLLLSNNLFLSNFDEPSSAPIPIWLLPSNRSWFAILLRFLAVSVESLKLCSYSLRLDSVCFFFLWCLHALLGCVSSVFLCSLRAVLSLLRPEGAVREFFEFVFLWGWWISLQNQSEFCELLGDWNRK
jgi:hypothetical protein